jgi:hypothetical protein
MKSNQLSTYVEQHQGNQFLKALTSTSQLMALTNIEKKEFILDCITAATFIGGWNVKNDGDVHLIISSLIGDFNTRFKDLTKAEVKKAFESGAKGYYGESFGISVAGIIKWILAYIAESNRVELKKELLLQQAKAAGPDIRQFIWRGERRDRIQAAYDRFLSTGDFYDRGNLIYTWLDREQLINYAPEQKRDFIERARVVLFERLQNWRDQQEKKDNERKFAELIESDTTAIVEAKKLALIDTFKYFRQLGIKIIVFQNTCLKFW